MTTNMPSRHTLAADTAAPEAPQPRTWRTDLQRHDLSVPGREVVQARVDFDPGATAPAHHHPGEEIIYVIEGVLEYRLEGQPPARLAAGEVLTIPFGTVHAVTNVGGGHAAELGTYFAELDFCRSHRPRNKVVAFIPVGLYAENLGR